MGDNRKKANGSLGLVGIVNRRKDMDIAVKNHWYRIPVKHAPKRLPAYLAFYQTRAFGKKGKSIRYYARVRSFSTVRRRELLPDERDNPRTNEYYYKFSLDKVRQTNRIIRNDSRRRISFGFTTMAKLRTSALVCQLFGIAPLEDIMRRALQKRGLKAVHEHCIMEDGRCRYRLDFAIFCHQGKINLECDNEKWHLTRQHRIYDRKRDQYLKRRGWVILRLPGRKMQSDINACLKRIEKVINELGGLTS